MVITSYDFIKNEDKLYMYKNINESALTFQVLYVNDILLIGNNVSILLLVNAFLSKNFSMKDLEETTYL